MGINLESAGKLATTITETLENKDAEYNSEILDLQLEQQTWDALATLEMRMQWWLQILCQKFSIQPIPNFWKGEKKPLNICFVACSIRKGLLWKIKKTWKSCSD
jgi:hypothetical protein